MAGDDGRLGGVTGRGTGYRSYWLDEKGTLHRDLGPEQLREIVGSGLGSLWVDLDSGDDLQWRILSDVFAFHPLAIEDTRSPSSRVKLEEYEGYIFVVVRGIGFALGTPDPYDIDTSNLYLFLGPNYLVTVHAGHSGAVATVEEWVETGPELLGRGVDHLAYAVLDTLVDLYFPCIDQLDTFVDDLEDTVLHGDGEVLEKALDIKRSLLSLRRHLAPMREVVASLANRPLAYLAPETQIYFRDVHDHVVRQVESVELYRELVTSAMESHFSLISNRMNEVIKTLSVIATVVLPPTLVASIYGMNFEWMPGLHSPYGFWIAIGMMVGLTGAFLAYIWWKGWL